MIKRREKFEVGNPIVPCIFKGFRQLANVGSRTHDIIVSQTVRHSSPSGTPGPFAFLLFATSMKIKTSFSRGRRQDLLFKSYEFLNRVLWSPKSQRVAFERPAAAQQVLPTDNARKLLPSANCQDEHPTTSQQL